MDVNPYQAPSALVADREEEAKVLVTWARAAKVWWSLMWRAVLFGVIVGGVFGFVMGVTMGAMGASLQTIRVFTTWAGVLIGIAVGIWVVRNVLRKSWSDFRIVLVPRDRG